MADNLTKGRIQKYLNKIKAAGLTPPDLTLVLEPSEQEITLRDFWNQNKPLPDQTKKEAKASIASVADDRVAALERQINEMRELMTQALAGKTQGVSTDDLLKAFEKASSGRTNEYKLLRPEYIPEGDLMDKAKVFFVPNNGHRVWGKKIGDHWTAPPLNLSSIHFRLAWGWVSREGNALAQKRIATFETKSKTIADWIESHPEFNRVIFLDLDEAMEASDNLVFATVQAKHYGALMGKSYSALTSMAAEHGLGTRPNYTSHDYASRLAEKFANNEISQQRANFDRQMRTNITKNAVTA